MPASSTAIDFIAATSSSFAGLPGNACRCTTPMSARFTPNNDSIMPRESINFYPQITRISEITDEGLKVRVSVRTNFYCIICVICEICGLYSLASPSAIRNSHRPRMEKFLWCHDAILLEDHAVLHHELHIS